MTDPAATVDALIDAINRADIEKATKLYEPGATLIAQPGTAARGLNQLREALGGFISMKPNIRSSAHKVVETGDLALYIGRWTLTGSDPSGKPVEMSGESTDILRRTPDGQWLIALDNPWGVSLLSPKT